MAAQSFAEIILPTLFADMVNKGIISEDVGFIVRKGLVMCLFSLLSLACAVAANFFAARTASGIAARLRKRVFYKVQSFSIAEVDEFGSASLITRTTNDVTQVQMFLGFCMRAALFMPLMAISGVIMAIYTGKKLSLIIIVAVPVLVGFIVLNIARVTGLFRSMQTKIDNLNRILRESLTGVRVVRAFCRSKYEEERYDRANADFRETSLKTQRIMGLLMPTVTVIMNVTNVAIMYFGGKTVMNSGYPVGDLMAYSQYVVQILMSIMMISAVFVMYPRASASAERINRVLITEPSIKDGTGCFRERGEGKVEFRNVTFSYPGAEESALNNISFTAEPGETTAIIGSTGSGKTTIANLILRFYDVTEGQILIDGHDVREYRLEDLRAKIGFAPQKAMQFSGSVADNLRIGKKDATTDEMKSAAQTAQASEFIESRQLGYDDYIAQGGANLSGGQKQRLSIARAIIKKPEIYLFDDTFSAVDYKTDAALRKALAEDVRDACVIIIAQRISTVMHAEKIIVLSDDGSIAGIGTHRQMMETCSVYQEIVQSQFKEGEVPA